MLGDIIADSRATSSGILTGDMVPTIGGKSGLHRHMDEPGSDTRGGRRQHPAAAVIEPPAGLCRGPEPSRPPRRHHRVAWPGHRQLEGPAVPRAGELPGRELHEAW